MKKLDIRWYKGKYKVKLMKKSKGNYLVKALEKFTIVKDSRDHPAFTESAKKMKLFIDVDDLFITVPRLLWTHQK